MRQTVPVAVVPIVIVVLELDTGELVDGGGGGDFGV